MAYTVLITGASGGIGEATARYFLQQHWNVVATARSPAGMGGWSREPTVEALRLDVTDEDSVRRAVERAVKRFGKLDVLVNNAGLGLAGPLEAIAQSDFEALFDVNVFGAVRVTRAVLPYFRRAGGGAIVNVSSIVGRFGVPFYTPYCATKFALEGLTEALRYELHPFHIRVRLVEPGGIKTKFKQIWKDDPTYEPYLCKARAKMTAVSASFPGPQAVAATIFRAATDNSDRLRYTASAGFALNLHRVLPDALWRRLLQSALGKAKDAIPSIRK